MTCPHQWSRSYLFRGNEVYSNLQDSEKDLAALNDCVICMSECGDPFSVKEFSNVVEYVLDHTNDTVKVHVRSKKPILDLIKKYASDRLIFSLQIDPIITTKTLIMEVSSCATDNGVELRYTVGQILYPFKLAVEFFEMVGEEAVRYNVGRITLVPVRIPGDDPQLLEYVDPFIAQASTEAVGPFLYQPSDIRLSWETQAFNIIKNKGYKKDIAVCRETNDIRTQVGFSTKCDCIL